MVFFKKSLTPEELGALTYELLRARVQKDSDLSLSTLFQSLDLSPEEIHEHYAGDVMVALMFAATIAIERSTPQTVAIRITSGMRTEFVNHLSEQGASDVQKAEWDATIAASFLLYRKSMEGYTGFEPPWKLGRQFYWNLTGKEEYVAMPTKIATLFLTTGTDLVQEFLNQYGPMMSLATARRGN